MIFLRYVKLLCDELEKLFAQAWGLRYVDNVRLIVTGKNEQQNCRILEKMAATAFQWGKANGPEIRTDALKLPKKGRLLTRSISPTFKQHNDQHVQDPKMASGVDPQQA